jgi:non-heme chloroperoxidase
MIPCDRRDPAGQEATMTSIRTRDGTEIFYKDWGPRGAQPIVFHHGWPLSADDWDAQMLFFLKRGYRVIAHDRRGHGRSTQTADGHDMDTYAADVAALVTALDLRQAIHVGHSTGGGEATRYVARHGRDRVAKLVLVGAVPPSLVKTPSYAGVAPLELFDGMRTQLAADRATFYWDFVPPFYGFNRPGAVVNDAVRRNWWRQAMMGAANAQYECIKAFSETDFVPDLKAIEAPVVVMHGEDDQIVPVANGRATAELVKNGTLRTYPQFPHGMCTTQADRINPDMLELVQAQPERAKAHA